jgi:hypothetical protein
MLWHDLGAADWTRLVKLLGSSFDNERAIAGAMLTELLRTRQATWADLPAVATANATFSFIAEQQAFKRGRATGIAEEQQRTVAAIALAEVAAFARDYAAGRAGSPPQVETVIPDSTWYQAVAPASPGSSQRIAPSSNRCSADRPFTRYPQHRPIG